MHEQTAVAVSNRVCSTSACGVHKQYEILVSSAERYATKGCLELHPLTRPQVGRRVPTSHELNMLVDVTQVPQLPLFHVCRWRVHVDAAKWSGQAESTSTWDTPRLRQELSQLTF